MTFLWPELLWLLLAVPLLAAMAFVISRRRARDRVAYPGLGRAGAGDGGRRRTRLPWILFLLGLASLFIAAARPTAVVMVPRLNQTILLALDSSLSMRAGDVKPSRLEAVQEIGAEAVCHLAREIRAGAAEGMQPNARELRCHERPPEACRLAVLRH